MESDSNYVDKFIINFVRENQCLYNKSDANFKSIVKKREIWSKLSAHLKNSYNIEMSAEGVEKRWTSLREMFGREKRRQKLLPSGSEPVKWELYRSMLFLLPHVAHRRSKSSLVTANKCSPKSRTILPKVDNSLPVKKCESLFRSPPYSDHEYSELTDKIDNDLQEASSAISTAVKAISSQFDGLKRKDGYMSAIEEGLNYVPAKKKTQCLIEVLQIIEKYEERS